MPRSKHATALTAQRGPVHGNFAEGAEMTQEIMRIMQSRSQWQRMSPARREALHMIVHKMHRICTGNFAHADHWDDIAGYAHLGATDGVSGDATVAPAPVRLPRRKVKAKKKVTARPRAKAKAKMVRGSRPNAVAKVKPKATRRARSTKAVAKKRTKPTL